MTRGTGTSAAPFCRSSPRIDAQSRRSKLALMPPLRGCCALVSLALQLTLVACENHPAHAPGESARESTLPGLTPVEVPARPTWDGTTFGRGLVVVGESPQTAQLIAPDVGANTSQSLGVQATLVGRNGSVQTVSVRRAPVDDTESSPGDECAPSVPILLALSHSGTPIAPWAVGFMGGQIRPLAMDSLEGLTRVDSADLVVQVTRLASLLPSDRLGHFVGLPFSVHSLWRFSTAHGGRTVAANLIRRVNQEARPLEERTMLVAERDSGSAAYSLAYFEQSRGEEETVESRDILAAALAGLHAVPTLVVAHDFGDELSYSILERDAPTHWRVVWASPRPHC